VIERINLGLQLGQGVSQWLLVQIPEQRLMESLVLSLRGRLVGLAGDRFHPEHADVLDELTETAAPRGVERGPIVGEESLRYSVGGHCLVEHDDRSLSRFARGHM